MIICGTGQVWVRSVQVWTKFLKLLWVRDGSGHKISTHAGLYYRYTYGSWNLCWKLTHMTPVT